MRGEDGKQSERKWRGNNESNEETLREEGDGKMWRGKWGERQRWRRVKALF